MPYLWFLLYAQVFETAQYPELFDSRYLYLALDLFTLSFPLAKSFDRRLQYFRKWKGLFTGILISGTVFLAWDIAFTNMGIWGFNPRYLSGIYLVNLPIEEWLFFLVVPYSCIFLYEVMNYYVRKDLFGGISTQITLVLAFSLLLAGILNLERAYTSITFIGTAVYLLFLLFVVKAEWLSRFYLGYLICWIPFLLVNGILTGSFIEEQVVWYDNAENLGIRIATIPIEDSIYLLLLLAMVTTFYEGVNRKAV